MAMQTCCHHECRNMIQHQSLLNRDFHTQTHFASERDCSGACANSSANKPPFAAKHPLHILLFASTLQTFLALSRRFYTHRGHTQMSLSLFHTSPCIALISTHTGFSSKCFFDKGNSIFEVGISTTHPIDRTFGT